MVNQNYPGPPQRWAVNFSNGLEYVNTVPGLLKGELRIFAYRVPKYQGDQFEWLQLRDAEQTETVKFFLHSLKWLDQLIDDAGSGSETSSDSRKLAHDVARNWWETNLAEPSWAEDEYVWGGHGFALRTTTLVALTELFPDEQWLLEALKTHHEKLIAEFDGYWNHGLVQALALMCVAGRLDCTESLTEGAARTTKCIEVMVDEQGCINEQAPEYARYIERLVRVAIRVFQLNGISGRETLDHKKDLLRDFIAHAMTPDYRFIELGDSVARTPSFMRDTPIEYVMSNGSKGKKIPPVAVYDGGFVFGRSGFGNSRPVVNESYYTIRFGPQRIIHGHNDHLSMTYWNAGRPVIVDPGHIGYTPGPERNYVRSHDAHNVPVIVGEKHDWSAHTYLRDHTIADSWQQFELEDTGYKNFQRKRSMFFSDCGPFVVLDDIKGNGEVDPRYITQRWNISPEFELVSAKSEVVLFKSRRDGTKLHLIRYLISGSDKLHGQTALDLHHGDNVEMLGFVTQHEKLAPNWNVGFGVTNVNARILTAGFVSSPADETGWSFRKQSDELGVLRIHIGSNSWAINVNHTSASLSGRTVPPGPILYGGHGIAHEE